MSSKSALGGMGLDALLNLDEEGDSPLTDEVMNSIQYLDIKLINPNPDQPRTIFNQSKLEELAESIKQRGVIQPIIVEKVEDKYIIIAGERRYRASKIAEKTEIPVIVKDFSAEEKLEIALVENIQREDLTPIEEAKAYKNLMSHLKLSQQKLADKVGKKRSTIANSLRLLNLPELMQESVNEGMLSPGHARAILAVVNPADQDRLHQRILDEEMSVRDAEKMVEQFNRGHLLDQKEKIKSRPKDGEILRIEQQFIDSFGTKVQVKGSLKKGKIEISYFSADDLDRIYDVISKG